MSLHVYSINETDQWNAIVRSFSAYDAYYLPGYVKAFQIHGDGQPLLFYYEQEELRAINVVLRRDIAEAPFFSGKIEREKFFDFITPYGYGGWLIEGSGNHQKLFSAYEAWCKNHNIVSEFVRYHPVLDNASSTEPYYDVVALGQTISMDLSSQDVIWSNLTSKNRNMVRKAIKSGINIYHGQFPAIYKTFREIYNMTMDSDNAKDYYYFSEDFYQSICNDLAEEAQVFWAELDGKVIATSIMISANGFMNYHLSGSLREYQHFAPSNLLLYKAALWGCSNGCRSLHLGGGLGSQEDSLYAFKRAFNRNASLQFYIGKKVFLDETYANLVNIKAPASSSKFFPHYRA